MTSNSKFDRRDFLAKLTAAGVAGIVGGGEHGASLLPGPFAVSTVRLDRLTAADFTPLVGQTFRIENQAGAWVEAELVGVESPRYSRRSPRQMRQPFSVAFCLLGAEPLPHQTYIIENAELGRFPLFLGAIGKSTSDVRLEAVFG